MGISVAGVLLILLNTLYELSPDDKRTMYIAYFNTMTSILLTFSPFLGIMIKNCFNIYVALVVAGSVRMLSGFVFLWRYYKEERIHT
jgi:hypothetical protein